MTTGAEGRTERLKDLEAYPRTGAPATGGKRERIHVI
jgi:hypothetical protein